ncbi:MAG: hypothetical protein QOK47_527 [Actinomycetota bacterium]|nr:hypothetical protein [Actinomycetota bacterium]
MNNFEQDLSAWETGEMTVSELESAHPELDVTGLVSLHESLTTMTAVPAPDPEMSWQRLEAQLPARSRLSDRAKSWVRRPLMIVIATTALSTGAAYAAGLEPQRSVHWVW